MRTSGYDEKCEELARYFLPKAKQHDVQRLAQSIQDTIEDLTGTHVHTCQQCEKIVGDECDCDDPDRADWCSANCRAAFDL